MSKAKELLDKHLENNDVKYSQILNIGLYRASIEAITEALTIHSVVVSEERTELPLDDIKGFAKYVLGLANRTAKRRLKPMTETEGDKLINDLWLKYKFDIPVPEGN